MEGDVTFNPKQIAEDLLTNKSAAALLRDSELDISRNHYSSVALRYLQMTVRLQCTQCDFVCTRGDGYRAP